MSQSLLVLVLTRDQSVLAGGGADGDGGAATCKTGAGDKSLAVLAPLPPPGTMTLSTHRAQCCSAAVY